MGNSKSSLAIGAALVTALVLLSILVGCGGSDATPQVLVITPTAQPTQDVAPTEPPTVPPPTATPTSEPPTGSPPTDTPTSEPPTDPPPTDTPVPEAPTPTPPPPPTNTAVPDAPPPVPTERPTNTSEISYPPPTLLAPQEKDAGSLRGQVTFVWNYSRPLEVDEAFQVLIWKEGEPHWGAAELSAGTEQLIDLDSVLPQRGGPGEYSWTVVVREKSTERLLSPEAVPWRLNYLGPWDSCASCDCQSQCRNDACSPCCDQCCSGCQ